MLAYADVHTYIHDHFMHIHRQTWIRRWWFISKGSVFSLVEIFYGGKFRMICFSEDFISIIKSLLSFFHLSGTLTFLVHWPFLSFDLSGPLTFLVFTFLFITTSRFYVLKFHISFGNNLQHRFWGQLRSVSPPSNGARWVLPLSIDVCTYGGT